MGEGRQLRKGVLVSHAYNARLEDGVVATDSVEWVLEQGSSAQNPLVRVDFGSRGLWLVPPEELRVVWQPPSQRRPCGHKEWLAAKRAQRRQARRASKLEAAARQHAANAAEARAEAEAVKRSRAAKARAATVRKVRRVRQTPAPAAAEAGGAKETKKKPKKKPKKGLLGGEATAVAKAAALVPAAAADSQTVGSSAEVHAGRDEVSAAREALLKAREAERVAVQQQQQQQQQRGEHAGGTSLPPSESGGEKDELGRAAQAVSSAEAALEAVLLREAYRAEKDAAARTAAAPPPKTLPDIAYMVLKEKGLDLLEGFQAFDSNGDGVLSAEELQSGFAKLSGIKLHSAQIQALILELEGEDGDGQISYLEFCTFFTKLANEAEHARHQRRFHALCQDGEWPAWDALSLEDQAAVMALGAGHGSDWPPSKAVTTAAGETARAEAAAEEARRARAAEAKAERRKPWRTAKKRTIDWNHGWLGLPPQVRAAAAGAVHSG
jgi:hypothetical protein